MNACDTMNERIHELFDGDDPAAVPAEIAEHLAACAGCRVTYDDLLVLRGILRNAPARPLPADALDAMWNATVRARPARNGTPVWIRAAVAACVATALIATTYVLTRPDRVAGPSAAELARAEAQADLVLAYAARALDATREAAAERVLAGKVSPAVRGTSPSSNSDRRNGS
jgi:predicted anti-sigma-YlaC factor YlaD